MTAIAVSTKRWPGFWPWLACLTVVALVAGSAVVLHVPPRATLALSAGVAVVLAAAVVALRRCTVRPASVVAPLAKARLKTVTPPNPQSLVEQMLFQRRYGLLLRPEIRSNLSEEQLVHALETLMNDMTALAGGLVGASISAIDPACSEDDPPETVWASVAPFYLDRCTVTNEQFAQFVDAGGYETKELWHAEVWPALTSFVDRDGKPGPRFWQHGGCLPGKEQHPVVGVSWYEAAAYARWLGKRLPTDAEWQKAGSCPVMVAAGKMVDRRFPWGDAVDRSRTNIWGSGPVETVPVDHFAEKTVGGIHQLVGNVWEWVADDFGTQPRGPRNRIVLPTPMKSIRGGAFDTYFDSQSTCQFQSGENPMSRRQNIGFRLCLSVRDLEMPPPEE